MAVETVEIFKDIPTYRGRYQISNLGRIYSTVSCKFLKPDINKDGYCQVRLYLGDGRAKKEMVHRLVAITFLPNPNHLSQINHKSENKLDNSVENLEWCTSKYNNSFGTRLARCSETNKKNGKRKRAVLQFTKDGEFLKEYPSAKDAETENNFSCGHITQVCKGKRKTAFNYIWKYKD